MYHTIEFAEELIVELEFSPTDWLKRRRVRRGTRLQAQIRPYVVETEDDLIEVADLFFADGTLTRTVPLASFSFVD
jgi:hypothetical protein